VPMTFMGVFEGLGNAITNLNITNSADSASVGMFSQTAAGAVLRDISLTREKVIATGTWASVGGLGAISYGTIDDVFVSAVIGAARSGQSGIVAGAVYNGLITSSSSSGSIVGNNEVGGIVGNLFDSAMYWSHSNASVSAEFAESGGVIGGAGGTIDHC